MMLSDSIGIVVNIYTYTMQSVTILNPSSFSIHLPPTHLPPSQPKPNRQFIPKYSPSLYSIRLFSFFLLLLLFFHKLYFKIHQNLTSR